LILLQVSTWLIPSRRPKLTDLATFESYKVLDQFGNIMKL